MCRPDRRLRSTSLGCRGSQQRPRPPRVGSRPHQQAPARHGRERHGDLQLGVVVAARPLVGVGPGVVEHVLALAVRFQVAGRAASDLAGLRP